MPRIGYHLLLHLVAAVALTLTACGTSDEPGSTTTATDPGAEASAVENGADGDDGAADSADSVAADDAGDASVGDAAEFIAGCQQYLDDFVEVRSAYVNAFIGQPADATMVAQMLADLVEIAPGDVKPAFQAYADQLLPFFEGMTAIGFEANQSASEEQMSQLTALATDIDQGALEQASTEIEAFFADNCEA